jgi:hypothetical protein
MVFVGEGRAEERHDSVAHDLVNCAFVAMHRLHHSLEDRVEDLARLLGIAVGQQLHGALEVGEEYGYLLALTFEGALRSQDLLGEVLGRVGLRRIEARRGAGPADWRRALETELRPGGQLCAAVSAPERKRSRTL